MPYIPSLLPRQSDSNLQELVKALEEEFLSIQRAVQEFEVVQLLTQFREPKRPRDGMLAVADGVEWDPGLGPGLYFFWSGTWEQVLAL